MSTYNLLKILVIIFQRKLNGNTQKSLSYIVLGGIMTININISYGEESIHNLAFFKALFIKLNIETLNISYEQKETIRKHVLKELEIPEK